jgi:hypothetical protein
MLNLTVLVCCVLCAVTGGMNQGRSLDYCIGQQKKVHKVAPTAGSVGALSRTTPHISHLTPHISHTAHLTPHTMTGGAVRLTLSNNPPVTAHKVKLEPADGQVGI